MKREKSRALAGLSGLFVGCGFAVIVAVVFQLVFFQNNHNFYNAYKKVFDRTGRTVKLRLVNTFSGMINTGNIARAHEVDRKPTPGYPYPGVGRTAVSLGNFDGLHLGHMTLVTALTRRASELGLPAVIYTFHEHPQNVLDGENGVKLLIDRQKKLELLSATGVDGVYFEHFDREFAAMAPEDFIKRILVDGFGARLVAVGSNYRFGRRGSGDVGTLRKYGDKYGFLVE